MPQIVCGSLRQHVKLWTKMFFSFFSHTSLCDSSMFFYCHKSGCTAHKQTFFQWHETFQNVILEYICGQMFYHIGCIYMASFFHGQLKYASSWYVLLRIPFHSVHIEMGTSCQSAQHDCDNPTLLFPWTLYYTGRTFFWDLVAFWDVHGLHVPLKIGYLTNLQRQQRPQTPIWMVNNF